MKHQAPSKDKSKKKKYRLLQFLFGALRVKSHNEQNASLLLYYHLGVVE